MLCFEAPRPSTGWRRSLCGRAVDNIKCGKSVTLAGELVGRAVPPRAAPFAHSVPVQTASGRTAYIAVDHERRRNLQQPRYGFACSRTFAGQPLALWQGAATWILCRLLPRNERLASSSIARPGPPVKRVIDRPSAR